MSLKKGECWWTVHFNKSCNPVKGIVCSVPTKTHERKQQPRGIVKGNANDVVIKNNVAFIS